MRPIAIAVLLLATFSLSGADQKAGQLFAASTSSDTIGDGWVCFRSSDGKYYAGDYNAKAGTLSVYLPKAAVIPMPRSRIAKLNPPGISNALSSTWSMLGDVREIKLAYGSDIIGTPIDYLQVWEKPIIDAANRCADLTAKRDALLIGKAELRNHAEIDKLECQLKIAKEYFGEIDSQYRTLCSDVIKTLEAMLMYRCEVNDQALPQGVADALAAQP